MSGLRRPTFGNNFWVGAETTTTTKTTTMEKHNNNSNNNITSIIVLDDTTTVVIYVYSQDKITVIACEGPRKLKYVPKC